MNVGKKRWMAVGMVLLLTTFVFACDAATSSKNEKKCAVAAWVSQEYYLSGMGNPTVSPFAYRVELEFTNTGSVPIEFDAVEAAFLPSVGRPLTQKTYPYDSTKGSNDRAYAEGDRIVKKIPPGGTEEFSFTTNGYTLLLLRDAGNKPLVFVALLANRKAVEVGPIWFELPSINSLPHYEKSERQPIKFTVGKPPYLDRK